MGDKNEAKSNEKTTAKSSLLHPIGLDILYPGISILHGLGNQAATVSPEPHEKLVVDGRGTTGNATTTTTVEENEKSIAGYETYHSKTTKTQTVTTSPELSGTIHYERNGPVARRAPQAKPAHTVAAKTSHPAQSAVKQPQSVNAISLHSQAASIAPNDVDFTAEGKPDAIKDTALLAQAVEKLKDSLGRYGVFETEMDLKILGMEKQALENAVQRDYIGKQESSLTVDYTSRRGKDFNQGLAKLDITHENIERITHAFNSATAALGAEQGKPIRQDEVIAIVQNTLRKELQTSR